MKLRRLSVAGFKTFARRTEVIFDRGITAIVGPNGSGKSNLVDAVRWALGETNARELRGQRMDEVIYAGGGDRQRLGLAEVDLVIDNDEGRLPLSDPEVSFSRRVVRGAGDTEFRVNGERVRLRDIDRLLDATGLTQSGYAVVAQNDIDAIIESSAADRRMLVEQAAGVRHLRAACDDALGRVGRAEAVLQRLADLLEDADPRLTELSSQAGLAMEQRGLSERLTELRGSLAREEWRAARARLKLARRAFDHAVARLEGAVEADHGFKGRLEAERARLAASRAERAAATATLESARVAAERTAGEFRRWTDRLRSAGLQRAGARSEFGIAAAQLQAAQTAIEQRNVALRREAAVHADRARAADADAAGTGAELQQALEAAESARRLGREMDARVGEAREAAREALSLAASLLGRLSGVTGGDGGVARAVAEGRLHGVRLWDCVRAIDAASSAAVEAALEANLGAWLVDDVAAASEWMDPAGAREQLLTANLDTAPRLVLQVPGRPAIDAVDVAPEARGAVSQCLEKAWLAPDLASAGEAIRQGAAVAILPDGRAVTRAGLRGGGRPGQVLALAADERDAAGAAQRASADEADALAAAAAGRSTMATAETRLAVAGDAARAARAAAAEAQARAEASAAALVASDESASNHVLASRLEAAEWRLLAGEADTVVALARTRAARSAADVARAEVDAAHSRAAQAGVPLLEVERLVQQLEAERSEVAVALARAEDERAAAFAEVTAAEAHVGELAEAVRGEAEEEGVELDPAAAERAEREIVRLERKVAALGPVNALAPEQFASLEQRVEQQREHHADIATACADIHALVALLSRELEERFEAVFGAVSFHFHQVFSELFPGGKATLRLEVAPAPVAAEDGDGREVERPRPGVEIFAQPPGKRLGPLRLLSGGERALTALAVILALQQVNPSPFYMFDEVDAALDDTNVLRFVRLLRRLSEQQQFIVVTHNHITMAAADTLWGVTIDSDGVSTVIGVRFDERTRTTRPSVEATRVPARVAG